MTQSKAWSLLVLMVVVVGLPLVGKWSRRDAEPRCAMNGLPIDPLYQVRIVDRAGDSHRFCCLRCAEQWLAQQADRSAAVYVTDEVSGAEIDSRSAYYVQSTVITNPVTGNRTRVFKDRGAAEAHVRAFRGRLLPDEDRPLVDAAALGEARHSRTLE